MLIITRASAHSVWERLRSEIDNERGGTLVASYFSVTRTGRLYRSSLKQSALDSCIPCRLSSSVLDQSRFSDRMYRYRYL
jgi:hypothetical protein